MFNVEMSVGGFGGHAVVALRGELDLADVPAVESHLIAAMAACGPSIIVDLAGLEFIDCRGLGVLVRVLKWTRKSGGDLLLAAPQQHVRRLLSATGLNGVFSLYASVRQAASGAKLSQPRPAEAARRPMPSRLLALASAQNWYAVRARYPRTAVRAGSAAVCEGRCHRDGPGCPDLFLLGLTLGHPGDGRQI
jgi:anti-sigma B factor antagonist